MKDVKVTLFHCISVAIFPTSTCPPPLPLSPPPLSPLSLTSLAVLQPVTMKDSRIEFVNEETKSNCQEQI
jgi:hypothetical protein